MIDRLSEWSLLILVTFAILASFASGKGQDTSKPNIVLILVDDSGLMDFGAFGGEARTPNIDRLAKEGLMFTNMHASPVCAPSRAMLLTGTDSHLTGVANLPEMLPEEFQNEPGYGGVLNDKVQTIATRLKESNYNTYVTGKWHLGHDEHTLPTKRGFDRSFILGGSGASNYKARGYLPMKPMAHWYADGVEVDLPPDFYSSKTYVDKTISFHREEPNKSNPFFSYIAFQAIHAPIQAPEEFVKHYRDTYASGWDQIRQNRFEKAKQLKFIPENAKLNNVFPQFKRWDELSANKQQAYVTSMAVMAGMLEAMDFHIGRYIEYLTQEGLMENTVFIITSDNGPDGADYRVGMPWAHSHGYHRNYDKKGSEDYFGYLGPESANALASPFSYFKYYAGEGGLRVPLIVSGVGIPKSKISNAFSFFTDIAPTIYDLAGIRTTANEGYAPISGKSLLPHINDLEQPVYGSNEGIGLEAANSSAYFLNGYKIVKNNIPLGDNLWHLYHLESDPGETKDLASQKPQLYQKMLAAYEIYEADVGVIKMPEGYSAEGEVERKSIVTILKNILPALLVIALVIAGIYIWWKIRRRRR
jgi:arylsulfatase/uncharacterized sulfatase